MLVAIITNEEYDLINGQDYDGQGSLYNPVKDGNNNWIITDQEIVDTIHPEFFFLRDKELIEWIAPIVEM
jgi:hypothetical protein